MIDVIIPARNEQDTIGDVVSVFHKHRGVDQVIVVVDAETTDATGDRALGGGASLVVYGGGLTRGKGQCVKRGLEEVKTERVFLCDADIVGLTPGHVSHMISNGDFVIGVPAFPLTEVKMTPAVIRNPRWFQYIMETWNLVSGERIVPTGILRDIDLHGYLMEVQINLACLARRIEPVYVDLRGLYSPFVMSERRLEEMERDRKWGMANGVFG